jgi:GNAT superfamily N-acetyltransferase
MSRARRSRTPGGGARRAGASRASRARRAGRGAPLTFHPATPGRWPDVERLFGPRGACGGCWCMHWRTTAAAYRLNKGEGNRKALRTAVRGGEEPGILAYAGREPVGWCALAPRSAYPRLAGSRVLAPVDDRPVWSVVCFFVRRDRRRTGLTVALLRAAAAQARRRGAAILEGYPVEPDDPAMPPVFAFTGLAAAFRRAGFREAARRSATRPIMRLDLRPAATP